MSSESKESDQRISIDREFVVEQLKELDAYSKHWPNDWLAFMRQFLSKLGGGVCVRCAGNKTLENGIGQVFDCPYCNGTGNEQ